LKNLSKYHVPLSFFEFWLSIFITYFSHLSSLSISTLNHFSSYLSTLSTPLSLILPYLAIFQAIFQSMAGPDTHLTPSPIPLTFLALGPAIYISHPSLPLSTFLPFPLNYSSPYHVGGLASLHLHPLSHVISLLLHLAIFQFRGFTGSSPHPPFFVTFTLHLKFCDLHFIHHPRCSCRSPKYFIPLSCESDQSFLYT
jgi:hypothetical protein